MYYEARVVGLGCCDIIVITIWSGPTPSSAHATPPGLPRVVEKTVPLPLSLFCEPYIPEKAAQHKVVPQPTSRVL